MNKWFISLLSCLFLLIGCLGPESQKPSDADITPPSETYGKDEEDFASTPTAIDYFPTTPLIKSYLGIGNEYAQYTETFFEKQGELIPSIIENGGTRVLRIYKVTENEIAIVYEQSEFYDVTIPSLSSLEDTFQTKPILSNPLEVGNSNREWRIVSVNSTLTVPYQEFKDVLVIEKNNQDGSINRQYWVKDLGKIKDEYVIQEENQEPYKVTSELQTVK
jgi:hypothetical protein